MSMQQPSLGIFDQDQFRLHYEKVEEELDRLVAEGTLEPIETADWAAPIVPVIKSDKKSIRIYWDF